MRRALTHSRRVYEMGCLGEADIQFQEPADASGNATLANVLAPVADLLSNPRHATGTLPAAVEIAPDEHNDIAAAIEERARKRARRAMSTHIQSGLWALTLSYLLPRTRSTPTTTFASPRRCRFLTKRSHADAVGLISARARRQVSYTDPSELRFSPEVRISMPSTVRRCDRLRRLSSFAAIAGVTDVLAAGLTATTCKRT